MARSSRRRCAHEAGDEPTTSAAPPPPSPASDSDPHDGDSDGEGAGPMMFSQQLPEASQPAVPAKDRERTNLESLDPHVRENLVTTLSRLILFKALAGETIDRTKVFKEAAGDRTPEKRVSTAAFAEAKKRLSDVFGYELAAVPEGLASRLPKTYQNRYYVVNKVEEDGSHSNELHSVHASAAADRGLLMLILALAYCRGEPHKGHRFLPAEALYRLLNSVDENIPAEPPAAGAGRVGRRGRRSSSVAAADDDAGGTPDVDSALARFVQLDYLLVDKKQELGAVASEGGETVYAMGPRSYLEIGRKQVICFCAEVLGEEPDPTMLAELEECEEEGEAMEE